jgi:DNA polymerase alpha-associated DNA helicase A
MDADFRVDVESYIPRMKDLLSMELAQEKLENEANSVPWPCAVLSLEACLCGTSKVRLCREGMESVIAESEKLHSKVQTKSRSDGGKRGGGRGRKGGKTGKIGKKTPLIRVEEAEKVKEREDFWRKKHGDHVFEGTASFNQGAAVVLKPKSSVKANEDGVRGVVTSVEDFALLVVLDEDIGDWGDEVRLELVNVPNETTHRRMTVALDQLGEKWMESPTAEISFAERKPSRNPKEFEIVWFNDQLDDSQKDSVKLAVSSNDIALIHGPPGTGKTTTIVEIIRQFVRRGERVLVCGPSNISVDHIVEKLSERSASNLPPGEKKGSGSVNMIRIGHPGRVLPSVMIHTLDSVVESSDAGGLVRDIRNEMGKLLMQVRGQRKKGKKIDRKMIFSEVRSLRKELRIREKGAIRDVISHANVVLSTNVGAGDSLLREEKFTAVVLDECAQALEPSSWIPILHTPKCKVVLCGDDCQLPPTIRSEAKNLGLETTLFHRLRIRYGDYCSKMLTTQYRMNELIMSWSSKEFYDGKLEADASVQHHVLSDMIHVQSDESSDVPLIFYDTSGFDYDEREDESMHGSKLNEQEAEIVRRYVDKILELGVKERDIAIIAPYRAQVHHLRSVIRPFHENIEISTVDGCKQTNINQISKRVSR